MSYEYSKDATTGQRNVSINDNLQVNEIVVDREGPLKGFVYHVPVPKNVAGALAIFGGDEAAMLDALSSKVQAMVYVRAANKLRAILTADQKENESIRNWMDRHSAEIEAARLSSPVLFSVDDAVQFRPGERELTPAGLVRLLGKTQVEAQKALSEGNMALAIEKFEAVKAIVERITAYTEALKKQAEAGEEA